MDSLQPAATEAVTAPPATDTGKYARLSRADIGALVKLHKAGKTQVEIAQALNCSQSTVSKWISDLTDTTDPAKEYLRGSALRMAENIVKRGLPRDHVAALKGLDVLNEDTSKGGVTVIVGGDAKVQVNVGQTLSPLDSVVVKRKSADSGLISAGSDNSTYVNQG